MTFARRYIQVTFNGPETIAFTSREEYGLRVSARVLKAGGFNLGSGAIDIYGLSLDHIKKLSTYGTRFHPMYNYKISVEAGDDVNGMSTVFVGGIQQAWADMQDMPDVPFHVIAFSGGNAATMSTPPSSYSGSADVGTMLQKLAGVSSLNYENNGMSAKLSYPYFWGSPWKQMKEIVDAANVSGFIDDETLAVWPKSGSRSSDTLLVSPQTGLRAYPTFTAYGVRVVAEFTRSLKYGSLMKIQSDMTPAVGTWRIIRIDYDLQANTPDGSWFVTLDGASMGSPVTYG